MTNHRILCPAVLHPCGDGRRVAVTEHMISVPLKRSAGTEEGADGGARYDGGGVDMTLLGGEVASGPTIDVYFAVVQLVKCDKDEAFFSSISSTDPGGDGVDARRDRADRYVRHAALTSADEMILFLQGGPGFGAPGPVSALSLAEKGSWAASALDRGYKRVVLMDQRGTGRSSPITKQTLERNFPSLFALDGVASSADAQPNWRDSTASGGRIAEQLDRWESMNPDLAAKVGVGLGQAAEYMAEFRADSIVRDAEDVKNALLLPTENDKPRPWGAALGQSFGGFCVMTYLSQIPHPPRVCLLTGGIAPMLTPPKEAYARLWDRVRERNLRYYDRYPGDISLVKKIVKRLLDKPAKLPARGKLTARRFLQLGLGLGGSPSAFASMHSLLSSALVNDGAENGDLEFTRAFLKQIESMQPFDDHPIYFLLHESIYADSNQPCHCPSDWAAQSALDDILASPSAVASGEISPPDFDYAVTCHPSDARPTLFYGEMVFPWMADGDYAELSGFGMRALAHSLAAKDDWGPLYDSEAMRRALAPGGSTRAAAAVYYDDMYVDFDCSMKLVKRGGPMEGCKVG